MEAITLYSWLIIGSKYQINIVDAYFYLFNLMDCDIFIMIFKIKLYVLMSMNFRNIQSH